MRICCWNVAGLMNKFEETWDYLEKFDMIGLTETWVDEEKWEKIRIRVTSNFVWNWYWRERSIEKEELKAELSMRRNLKEATVKEISDAAVECKLEYNGSKWRIITVYSQKIEETLETLME